MSFFEELKRRNVVKVGVAYLVGSWILVQVADILFDAIGTPEWVMQTMLVFLGIGFFVALFFAWAFELTPEGIKKESEVDRTQSITPQTGKKLNNTIVVLLALAVVYLLLDKFSQKGSDPISGTNETAATATEKLDPTSFEAESEISRQSIAVLPFDNRSNREEDQFFTDGIHDDLLTTIARIGSMKVISRTSVMEYKDTTKKIPEIAKELGVANILEGGIQRSGNQVRINVQLIDAYTDEHLWAEIFDRELTAENLFAIQSEISQKIADALETALSPDEVERINAMPTDNLAAYEAYMRGRQLMATRTTANLALARQDFREAVDLDPDFALAWVGLADAANLQSSYGAIRVQDTFGLREEAIQRALEIDPGLGEAHVSKASLHADRNEITEAEAAYKLAIELNPNYATAYMWYGGLLSNSISRTEEWVDLMKKAAELDPRSAIINSSLAGAFAYQGMYSRAEQLYKKNIELNPGFAQGIRVLGDFYVFNLGQIDKGIEYHIRSIQADPGSVFGFAIMVMNLVELGDFANAEIYRQRLADISEDFWMLGWADLTIAHGKNNSGGVEEAWNWLRPKVPPGIPFINEAAALMRLAYDDPLEAREILVQSSPGWLEPQEWAQLIDRTPDTACITAWTLAQTGDEELGQALLDQALAFVERMPTYVEHADNWKIEACYLAAGDTERAMQIIETQLAHNHLFWWKTYHQLPMYEAVRFEPRYQEIQTEVERRLAEQRVAVAQMNLGTGP